jgi:hypothetical protein
MSILSYNSVTLPYALTTQFRQEAIPDESDTDWMCSRFDVLVQSIVHSSQLALLAPDIAASGQTNPANIMRVVYSRLMERRKQLSMTFNGQELIPQAQHFNENNALTGTVDAQNGPKPQYCGIVQLNSNTWIITYHVIAHYWENNTINPNGTPTNFRSNNVLNNRWSETVDIDGRGMSKTVRDGKFQIRSDNASGLRVDELRPVMAMLGVPPGFLRSSSRYTVTPDGLALQYQVADYEVYKKPPAPAFEAEGQYFETLTNGGAMRHGEVFLKLRGSKTTNEADLVRTAIAVAASKVFVNGATLFPGANTPENRRGFLEAGVLGVNLYENECQVRLRVRMPPANNRVQGLAGVRSSFVFTPGSDIPGGGGSVEYTPPYLLRGSAGTLLRAAAYFDPNLVNMVANAATGQLSEGTEPGTGGLEPPGN